MAILTNFFSRISLVTICPWHRAQVPLCERQIYKINFKRQDKLLIIYVDISLLNIHPRRYDAMQLLCFASFFCWIWRTAARMRIGIYSIWSSKFKNQTNSNIQLKDSHNHITPRYAVLDKLPRGKYLPFSSHAKSEIPRSIFNDGSWTDRFRSYFEKINLRRRRKQVGGMASSSHLEARMGVFPHSQLLYSPTPPAYSPTTIFFVQIFSHEHIPGRAARIALSPV